MFASLLFGRVAGCAGDRAVVNQAQGLGPPGCHPSRKTPPTPPKKRVGEAVESSCGMVRSPTLEWCMAVIPEIVFEPLERGAAREISWSKTLLIGRVRASYRVPSPSTMVLGRDPLPTNPPRPAEPPSLWRRRHFLSRGVVWLLFAAAALIALFVAGSRASDIILYNHSPSMPVGFYVRTAATVERGAIVTVRAADVAAHYAHERGFADAGDRFVKRVVAAAGDVACAEGDVVTLNGVVAARREDRDSAGRTLPRWHGCHTLARDELLLLGDAENSFDGRYWGVVQAAKIEGVWRPLAVRSQ